MWVIESEEFLNMLRLSNLSVPLDYTDSSLRAAILKKCEWGATGYPFQLKDYQPKDEDFEFDEEE